MPLYRDGSLLYLVPESLADCPLMGWHVYRSTISELVDGCIGHVERPYLDTLNLAIPKILIAQAVYQPPRIYQAMPPDIELCDGCDVETDPVKGFSKLGGVGGQIFRPCLYPVDKLGGVVGDHGKDPQ